MKRKKESERAIKSAITFKIWEKKKASDQKRDNIQNMRETKERVIKSAIIREKNMKWKEQTIKRTTTW
jgi:hypothetical protein